MASRHSRPTSVASSLMQDVPGSFPASNRNSTTSRNTNEDHDETAEPEEVTYRSLSQLVYSRRAEYVRAKHIRIKIGTWNVASFKGTEKDVGGWFVGGRGVAERLTGLNIADSQTDVLEDVSDQEARYERKQETLPKGDQGVLPKGDEVGLYVLNLQELVDISSATEALRPYTDPAAANKFKEAMNAALPSGYVLVAEQQLIGLLLLVYAAPDVAKDVKSVSTTSVGTGLMGYMGNKGAVTARIVLGETTRMVFINSHLAAGADKASLERRNWDAAQIINRTRFEPIKDAMDLSQSTGEQIGDEDFAFWCGDLNYRLTGVPGDDVRRLLMLHTRNEYDLSQGAAHKVEDELRAATESVKHQTGNQVATNAGSSSESARSSTDIRESSESIRATTSLQAEIEASEDPTSLQTTLSSLLPHDELQQQMKSRKAFHDGWREGPITFLPTYKYDPGSVGVFDSSEKKRGPSWCDRILYRTRRDRAEYEAKLREETNARKKDAEMHASGIVEAASEDDLLYDYDPETDGAELADEYDEYDDLDEGVVLTKEGFEDEIELEYYTAHQRVLSSDHKPLDASFMLKYDAVVPELKAKVHAEAAKELDKAENEGRPNVTVVVDEHHAHPEVSESDGYDEKFEGVWFGEIRWAQSKHRSLTIANTSRVKASFSFIERPVGADEAPGIAPKWLDLTINDKHISSSSTTSDPVTLEPGETCAVQLEVRIMSMDDVRHFNEKEDGVDDILVLRVENGRDHFIPLRAKWLASTLGRHIDKLVRIPEGGIRRLQGQKPADKGKTAKAVISAASAFARHAGGAEDGAGSTSSENTQGPDSPPKSDGEEKEPVRFSAPRELFRLTEVIETLGDRIVAEWNMTNSTPLGATDEPSALRIAPWDEYPAWPFDEECWTERTTSHWREALSEASNALDDDKPIVESLPGDLPRIQRLYVLSSFLLMFLQSMTDGVITSDLWPEVEAYLIEVEKAKKKPCNDDQRIAIQEILSQSPSHNISFVLITSMLERMIQERIANGPANENAPVSPVSKAGGTLKRMANLGRVPQAPPKEQASPALAKIFGDVIVRVDAVGGEKAKAALQKRKAALVEIFLQRDAPQ